MRYIYYIVDNNEVTVNLRRKMGQLDEHVAYIFKNAADLARLDEMIEQLNNP